MATSYPDTTQLFPKMLDMTYADGVLVHQYQLAMQSGNMSLAKQILDQIPDGQNKIVTADYLNTINDTVVALENYYQIRYSPAYIVSPQQPAKQEATDFWFQVTG